jgi:O-antigen/teichoic acid export membrane protein
MFSSYLKSLVRLIRQKQAGMVGNLLWVGLAGGFSWLLNSAVMIYAARAVGRDALGLLTFGLSVTSYATILVNGGLLIWGVRAIAQTPQRAGALLVIVNGLQLLLAVVAYLALVVVTSAFFSAAERGIVLVCGVLLFAQALSMQWVCMGLERFRLLVLNQLGMNVVSLAMMVALVRQPADVARVPLVMAGSQVGAAGVLLLLLYRQGVLRFGEVRWQQAGAIVRASLSLGVSGSMLVALRHANTILLQVYHGPSVLGLFSAPYRLVEVLVTVVTVFANVFLPRLSALAVASHARLMQLMYWYVRLMMSMAVLIGVVFVVEPHALLQLLYGEQFLPASDVLRAMGFAVVWSFAALTYMTGLLATGKDRAYVVCIGVGLLLALVGGGLLVPAYGLAGATAVVASLDLALWLMSLPVFRRVMGSLLFAAWVWPLLAGGVLAGWLAGSAWWGMAFWLRLPLGMVLYGVLVVPWGMVRKV